MKKIISVVLACVLLSALFVMPASAAQSNVDVSALKFTKQPTIDGVISVEEWGEKTVTVKGSEATTIGDEAVNALNTYMEFETEDVQAGLNYDLWLRWDADYYYIGVVVEDPDGFSLPAGGDDIWNGDVVQFRVDPQGPNSVMKNADEAYDYKTTEFDFNRYNYSSDANRAWANSGKIINAGVGLVKRTTVQAYDMEKDVIMEGTLAGITSVDTGDGVDTFTCTTTYEIAVPWSTIAVDFPEFAAADNAVVGMTLVVLNSCGATYNALLTWGSGVCGGQAKNARKTSGGSNAVTLSADTVTPADEYAVVTEETTTEEVTTEPKAEGTTTTKAPADGTDDKSGGPTDLSGVDDGGLPTAAIVAIIVAVVLVIAIVVIVVVKKKGKKAE